MHPHIEKYRTHLDGLDMTQTQQTEMLLALWSILENVVDRALGDDPVQHIMGKTLENTRLSEPESVQSKPSHKVRKCKK